MGSNAKAGAEAEAEADVEAEAAVAKAGATPGPGPGAAGLAEASSYRRRAVSSTGYISSSFFGCPIARFAHLATLSHLQGLLKVRSHILLVGILWIVTCTSHSAASTSLAGKRWPGLRQCTRHTQAAVRFCARVGILGPSGYSAGGIMFTYVRTCVFYGRRTYVLRKYVRTIRRPLALKGKQAPLSPLPGPLRNKKEQTYGRRTYLPMYVHIIGQTSLAPSYLSRALRGPPLSATTSGQFPPGAPFFVNYVRTYVVRATLFRTVAY